MPRTRASRSAKRKTTRRKRRLTLSLDESTVRFLHRRQAERKTASLSAAVEDLVAASRQQAELDELEAQTKAYYDSLTPEEMAEDVAWGRLGERELMNNPDLD